MLDTTVKATAIKDAVRLACRAPRVLIRVGVAPARDEVPPATPRRPLGEVLRLTSQPGPRNA